VRYTEKNSIIVFPLSIVLIKFFMDKVKQLQDHLWIQTKTKHLMNSCGPFSRCDRARNYLLLEKLFF
jgi:hypothetical protein